MPGLAFGELMGDTIKDAKREKEEAREAFLKARSEQAKQEDQDEEQEDEEIKQAASDKEAGKEHTESVEKALATDSKESDKDTEQKADGKADTDETETLSVDDRLAEMEQALKLLQIRDEKKSLDIDKWKNLAQTRQGELDYIKKHGRTRTDRSDTYDLDFLSESDGTADSTDGRDPLVSELYEEAGRRARNDAIGEFMAKYPDMKEREKDLVEFINANRSDYAPELDSGSPKKVYKATTSLLNGGRLHLQEQDLKTAIEEAKKKKANNSEETRKKKRISQLSESGGSSSTKLTDSAPVDFSNLSVDEMRKVLKKQKGRTGIFTV